LNSVDGRDEKRGVNPKSLANLNPWKPGESGGGGALGGHQTARWRKAINEAVTEDDCADVIRAMKKAACGIELEKADKEGGTSIYSKAPDSAAARLFFEVLKVIGPDAGGVDLKDAPEAVLEWIAANGKGN